jgi:hypothetical protein
MATPIGVDHITAIVNRYLMPDIIDLAYQGNPLFFRLYNSNRRFVDGGPQIEQPVMVSKFTAGGSFSDLDVLDMTPQNTTRTVAWDWKEKYVPVAFSNLAMTKMNSADSIANGVQVQVEQAAMQMRDLLGTGLYSAGTNSKELDGLTLAIDTSGVYAGIDRSANLWWQGKRPASAVGTSANVDIALINTLQASVTVGGRFPTLGLVTQAAYASLWSILYGKQQFYSVSEKDAQMASAGFNNFVINGTPFVIDPKIPSYSTDTGGQVFLLNEDFIKLAVTPLSDFRMEPFQQAFNQAAIGAKLLFTGNLLVTNPQVQVAQRIAAP